MSLKRPFVLKSNVKQRFTTTTNIKYSSSAGIGFRRQNQYMRMRQYTKKNISEFQNEIKHIDWSNILHSNSCQIAFSLLHETFIKSYDHCFPFKLMKASYNNLKIWLTPALKNP